jgi:hypothetical protein
MKKIYSFFLFAMCCFLIGILTSIRSQNNKFYYAFDETQLLKTKQTGLRGQSAKIQIAGWKEGVYLVRVKYEDEIVTGKLLVKK